VVDLLRPALLKAKLERAIEEKNILLKHYFNAPVIELAPLLEQCLKLGERLKPYITDVRGILVSALERKRPILFEGAQGTLLDVDHGTYPYVTSSSTISGGAFTGAGVGFHAVNQVIGITKAYTTRVGTGPFPTEMEVTERETAERIRKIGAEFGATTGRPRRTGWLDLVAMKYAVEVNGLTGLALMKSDVLQEFKEVRMCVAYKLDGREIHELPSCIEDLERVEPVYETFPGWGKYDTKNSRSMDDLPKELQSYTRTIEKALKVPVVLMSTGPGREETLVIRDPFRS
jgi:adenylosuccinate synthase